MAKAKDEKPKQTAAAIKRLEKSAKDKKAAFMKKCKADLNLKGFEIKKQIILHALKICRGHVTNACAMVNITRKTFHNYRNDDPAFEEAYREIKMGMMDHVVSKLFERIDAGSDSSIQFYLERQGADEGWNKQLKMDGTMKNINYNVPLTDEEVRQYAKALEEEF
ncbi:hypothetical protein [Pedobacter antarcticus]|uniref:hypothetical protein n=1 Tax=Pedobacter antarcticus TaxID=34086 RepID=UPI00292EA8A1|nr:hypothetical protein [Pedobacter antarcticus]